MKDLILENYHRMSFKNKERLESANICCCFHCLKKFKPEKITRYSLEEDGSQTAYCPYCSIDSVLGFDEISFKEKLILKAMKKYFFTKDSRL